MLIKSYCQAPKNIKLSLVWFFEVTKSLLGEGFEYLDHYVEINETNHADLMTGDNEDLFTANIPIPQQLAQKSKKPLKIFIFMWFFLC